MLAASTAPRTLTQTEMTTRDHILKVSKPESAVLMTYEVGDEKDILLGHVSLTLVCIQKRDFTPPPFQILGETRGPLSHTQMPPTVRVYTHNFTVSTRDTLAVHDPRTCHFQVLHLKRPGTPYLEMSELDTAVYAE